MEDGDWELEPVPWNPVDDAEEMCANSAWDDECERRAPELADVEDDHDYRGWQDFLEELDELDADAMARDLAECEEGLDGRGWIQDTQGAAVFIEYR